MSVHSINLLPSKEKMVGGGERGESEKGRSVSYGFPYIFVSNDSEEKGWGWWGGGGGDMVIGGGGVV